MNRPFGVFLILFIIAMIGIGVTMCHGQEMRSVLVTPRTQLDVQAVETPTTQGQVTYQAAPPQQVIYVQQQSPYDQWARDYWRYHMWFNATYERRGLFFPRYVRRPDACFNQFMLMRMFP